MATFKSVVRGERKDGFMHVYIRVSHRKRHGYIKTDKMVTRRELNKQGEIKDPMVVSYCAQLILDYNRRLNEKDISRWTVAEVVDYLLKGNEDICFSDYARQHADRMIDRGQERNAKNYLLAAIGDALTAENRFPILLGNLDLILDRCGVAEFRLLGKSDELLDIIPFPFEKRSVIRNGIISAVDRGNTADNGKLAASSVLGEPVLQVSPWSSRIKHLNHLNVAP